MTAEIVRNFDLNKILDRKTNKMGEFLFTIRGHYMAGKYINNTIIPLLCEQAGVFHLRKQLVQIAYYKHLASEVFGVQFSERANKDFRQHYDAYLTFKAMGRDRQ
ncbi:MAG: hypothetical protein ABI465_10090 [Ktedonobacteraceae bacterium]